MIQIHIYSWLLTNLNIELTFEKFYCSKFLPLAQPAGKPKFSKVSSVLNWLYTTPVKLTFEKFDCTRCFPSCAARGGTFRRSAHHTGTNSQKSARSTNWLLKVAFWEILALWGRLSALSTSHRHKFSKVSVLVNSVHKLTIDSRFLRNSQKSARSSIDYINWLLRVGFWEILALGGHLSALSTSHWSKFSTSSALLNWLHKTESTKLDFEQF